MTTKTPEEYAIDVRCVDDITGVIQQAMDAAYNQAMLDERARIADNLPYLDEKDWERVNAVIFPKKPV